MSPNETIKTVAENMLGLLKIATFENWEKKDLKVTLGEASELLTNYTEDEDTYVLEIEPDGYVDSDGISYLTIYIAQREKDEEVPFK